MCKGDVYHVPLAFWIVKMNRPVLHERLSRPMCEQQFDNTAGFRTQARELLLSQQPIRIDSGKLGQCCRPPHIIEGSCDLVVPTLEDSEDGQIALMMTLGAIRPEAVNFFEDALAKPLQCHWSHLSQQLPIRFFDLARHDDS